MAVIPNLTKKKCAEGKVVIGAVLRIARTMDVGVALKACGYDFLFIDAEHGTYDLDVAAQISVAALGHGITPLVRIASLEGNLGARVLDGGAQGIILPHVNSSEDAEEFVSACRFPPLGRRGSGGGFPQAEFDSSRASGLLENLDREALVVAMIETAGAAEHASEIAAVEGIDVLFIGANDLCLDMGVPAQYDDGRVIQAFEQVIEACKKNDKTPGMGGFSDTALIERHIRGGMRFIVCGTGISFLMAGAKARAEVVQNVKWSRT